MKRNDNLPLNLIDKMNSRVSMMVSAVVLAVICLVFNRIDYHMIRKPAEEAYEAARSAQEEETAGDAASVSAQSVSSSVTVVAVGDNLIEGDMLNAGQAGDGQYDYSKLYANVAGSVRAADLAIVNQETPLTQDSAKVSAQAPYAAPYALGDALADAGFDVFTCATEYMAAGGDELMADTLAYASSHPELRLVGLHAAGGPSVQTTEINGIRIALMNYVIPISGQTVNIGSGSVPEYYWDDEDGVYYVLNETTGEWTASEQEPTAPAASGDTGSSQYELDILNTSAVSNAISQAEQESDCVIFCAHWGKGNEPMPTEYQKQWATFLLKQGVDVLIGSYPNVLSPYCTLEDEEGHSMLVYYSLGNFAAMGQTLKQLIGGMASFTIQKSSSGENAVVTIKDADLELLTTHYNLDNAEYAVYRVADYTDALSSTHSVLNYYGEDYSVERIQTKADEILAMMVEPSSSTTMLSYTFDASGNIYDSDGNTVTDTDSITSSQYYANLG